MKVYKTKLYFTKTGFVSFDKTYQNDNDSKLVESAVAVGSIYVYKDEEEYKELITDIPIPVYVKADQEDLFFPLPVDYKMVMKEIEEHNFSLHIRESDIIEKNAINSQDIQIEEICEEKYIFFTYQHMIRDLDAAKRLQLRIQEKYKELSK